MKTYYEAKAELSDGRCLKMEFSVSTAPSTFFHPSESVESQPLFTIDGELVLEWELPLEVNDEFIEDMKYRAIIKHY